MSERPLRILQLNTFDVGGGAAKVAWSLFTGYRARGCQSWLAVGQKQSTDPDVVEVPRPMLHGSWSRFWWGVSQRLQRRPDEVRHPLSIRRVARGLARVIAEPERWVDEYRGVEDFHFAGSRELLKRAPRVSDIVHGHNLHGSYFDLRMLPALSQQMPVMLTLHDAWLLSGHCSHSFGCARWTVGCGRCPDLAIYPAIRRDATALNWRRKHEIYRRSCLYISTPSRWLLRKVEHSMLAPAVVEARVIPNGVDRSIFQPADKRAARAVLDLPQEANVLLIAGQSIRGNVFKDYQCIREAVDRVATAVPADRLLLLALGDQAPTERFTRGEVRFIPYQNDPKAVARYYQAADVYVHASRVDTFPMAVLEAMACGVPVVASAVGGIPEQLEDGHAGFLVRAGDREGLAARLVQLLTSHTLRCRMGEQGAECVLRHFDLQRQVNTYLEWYRELVEHRDRGVAST